MGVTRRPGLHISKLGGVGLAHDQRARLAQQRHHMGIARGLVALIDRRVKTRGMIVGINDVLDAHRHTREQTVECRPFQLRHLRAQRGGVQRNKGLDVSFARMGVRQKMLSNFGGADTRSAHLLGNHPGIGGV